MRAMVRAFAVLAITAPIFASAAQQTGTAATNKSFRRAYEASREITVTGSVRGISVHSKAPSGAHLLITTSQGLIDMHVGSFALRGSQPLSSAAGRASERGWCHDLDRRLADTACPHCLHPQ